MSSPAFSACGADAAMPAVCASASVRITPGTSGLPGKWPANIGSSPSNVVAHSAETPGSHAISSRTKTNGGLCGKPRSTIDLGPSFVSLTRAIFPAAQPFTK